MKQEGRLIYMNSVLFTGLMCVISIIVQGVVILVIAKILSILNDRILPDEDES